MKFFVQNWPGRLDQFWFVKWSSSHWLISESPCILVKRFIWLIHAWPTKIVSSCPRLYLVESCPLGSFHFNFLHFWTLIVIMFAFKCLLKPMALRLSLRLLVVFDHFGKRQLVLAGLTAREKWWVLQVILDARIDSFCAQLLKLIPQARWILHFRSFFWQNRLDASPWWGL